MACSARLLWGNCCTRCAVWSCFHCIDGYVCTPVQPLCRDEISIPPLLVQPPPESEGARVNSLSFHRVEDRLVTATDDDGIRLYDTARGTETHMPTAQAGEPVWSRKYGVANICFTHDPYSVLYSSNKVRSALLCLPLCLSMTSPRPILFWSCGAGFRPCVEVP